MPKKLPMSKPELDERVYRMSRCGMTPTEIAADLHVSVDTIRRSMKRLKESGREYKRGKQCGLDECADLDAIKNEEGEKRFDAENGAVKVNENNRRVSVVDAEEILKRVIDPKTFYGVLYEFNRFVSRVDDMGLDQSIWKLRMTLSCAGKDGGTLTVDASL